MSAQPSHSHISPEDYLILDEASETRYEYLNGEVYAMSGGTPKHSRITHNINGLMFIALRQSPCKGYESNIRLQISKKEYLYPDFTAVCGKAEFDEAYPNNLKNPTMVVEVVSDTSEHRDHFIKLNVYRSIESLRIYMIVEQTTPKVTLHLRQDNGWLYQVYEGLDAVVPLDAIGTTLNLSELYETVDFDEEQS